MARKSTRTIKKFEWYNHPHRNLIYCRESGILLILQSHSDLMIPTFEDQSWKKKKYHALGQKDHKVKSNRKLQLDSNFKFHSNPETENGVGGGCAIAISRPILLVHYVIFP
jgi:hypothetical protein